MNGDLPDRIAAARKRLLPFALSLVRDQDRAEDLVQETMMRALAAIDSFDPSTNLDAWLFTILRNFHLSIWRKRRREVEDADGTIAGAVPIGPNQVVRLQLADALKHLDAMPADMRDAFRLVVIDGCDYETVADLLACEVGTVKSRVHRAKEIIERDGLQSESPCDIGDIRKHWHAGRGASEIASLIGCDLVTVMRAIATFGRRRSMRLSA